MLSIRMGVRHDQGHPPCVGIHEEDAEAEDSVVDDAAD